MRFTLRLNEELDALTTAKAKELGVSKNSFIVSALWNMFSEKRESTSSAIPFPSKEEIGCQK